MFPSNALALANALARENGLILGAFHQFESHDKLVVAFTFGLRNEDGEIRWFEPVRSDDTMAFARFPRVILRADGTVFRDLLFNPFA